MCTKVLTPMTRRCKRSVSSPRSILNGVSLLSAFFGVLFLKFAAGLNSSPHMDDGKLPDVLAARVGTPTNDVTTEGDSRLADEQWKRLKSLLLCLSTSRRRSTSCISRLPR